MFFSFYEYVTMVSPHSICAPILSTGTLSHLLCVYMIEIDIQRAEKTELNLLSINQGRI